MTALINLLPDVRQAKLKDERRRRLTTGISATIGVVSIGVIAVLFLFIQGQFLKIKSLTAEISDHQAAISQIPDLEDILTTQQHLDSLPSLYSQRVYLTKFYTLLGTISPKDLALQSIALDGKNSLKFSVRARNYFIAAKFAKALEASNVTLGFGAKESNNAHFTNVQLEAVSAEIDGKVTFAITATMGTEVTNGQK